MFAVGKVKAGTSEAKLPLEIGFTPSYSSYSARQYSEVNLYWFSLPNVESSEVILTDPNGVVVFTSDKTGENSEVFIPEVVGTYTATITAILIPGGDAKTKEEVLQVQEGKLPSVSTLIRADGAPLDNKLFEPNTGLDLDTKFSWSLSSDSGTMSFLIEISDPDGDIVHSVSGDAIEEVGSYSLTAYILGEYTITATATNPVGPAADADTILCENWPALEDGVSLQSGMKGHWWYPKPRSIIDDRMASKWGWWFELTDVSNPGMTADNGIPLGEPNPSPYKVIFKYRTGSATEAKIEFIDPDGLVDFEKDELLLTLTQYDDWNDREVDFGSYFPKKRGNYTARLILTHGGAVDPLILEHDIPCYNNLQDKGYSPEILFNPRFAQEHDTFTLVWDAKGGKNPAVEWIDPEGNVGTSSSDTGNVEFLGVAGAYTASIASELDGEIRNGDTRIDVVEYQEPIPSISFSTSNPMMGNSVNIHWDSRSTLPGRTAVVEWKDPDGIVLGTYTDLVGSSEKIIVEKIGTYSATIAVTTPEGLVVPNSVSALSVPYAYVKPTFTLRGDGLTFKHYTQLNGTGRTENGIIYNVDINSMDSNGIPISLNKNKKYESVDTKFEMSVDGGPWIDMPLGGVNDGAYGEDWVNYVGLVPWSLENDKPNVKIKLHMGPTLTKKPWTPVAVEGPFYNEQYDPRMSEGYSLWGPRDLKQNDILPNPSPSGYSFSEFVSYDNLSLTIGSAKAKWPSDLSGTLDNIRGSRGWNCSGKNIMDYPLAFYNTCPDFTNLYMDSRYRSVEPHWPHTGWGSQKHSKLTQFTVPAGVTTMYANCVGSGGRYANVVGAPFSPPGGGAYASGSFSVTPGEVLTLQVHHPGNNDGYSAVKRANGTVLVKAVQGQNGTRTLGGHVCKGGQASACVGSKKYSGGNGGRTGGPWNFSHKSNGYNIGGCGGAAGPGGKGGNGGDGCYGMTSGAVGAQGKPQNGTGGSASGGSSSGVSSTYNNTPGNNHGHIQQGGCVGIIGMGQSGVAFSKGGSNLTWQTANHGSNSFSLKLADSYRAFNHYYPEGLFGGGSWHGDNGGVYIWY